MTTLLSCNFQAALGAQIRNWSLESDGSMLVACVYLHKDASPYPEVLLPSTSVWHKVLSAGRC